MKLSMEIFGIPQDAVARLRDAVCTGCEKFLLRSPSPGNAKLIKVQEGTCPFTGRSYMYVVANGIESADQRDIDAFASYVWSFHPRREEEVVRRNSFLRLEDTSLESCDDDHERLQDEEDDTLTCWMCGRLDGEECYDYERDETFALEVKFFDMPRVPLCTICYQLLQGEPDTRIGE